jgi:hypothetical protein
MNHATPSLPISTRSNMRRPVYGWFLNAAVSGLRIVQCGFRFVVRNRGIFGMPGVAGETGTSRRKTPTTTIGHRRARFCASRDAAGNWMLTGALREPAVRFSSLPAAISFAREDAGAAEADIEIWAEGFYAFVHQAEGWPHRICAPSKRTILRSVTARGR